MKIVHWTKLNLPLCIAIALVVLLTGCDTTELKGLNDVASKAIVDEPKSDVSGQVTDAWTGEPIVGAKVMVEGFNISATTDEFGNYKLEDVPVNTDDQGNVLGEHRITIDMRSVTSPVRMSDTTITNRYADLDTTGNTLQVVSGNTGNAATAESGLANSRDFNVGKSSATFTGHVFDVDGVTPVSGIVVELWTTAGEFVAKTTSATDDTATDTTDETGEFTFSNVEAGGNYNIFVMSNDSMMDNATTVTIYASEETTSNVDILDKVVLGYNDATGPTVIATSPESGTDLPSTSAATIIWTFNEAIAQNDYRDSTSSAGLLYQDITVQQTGMKTGGAVTNDVAFTLAWNTDFTELAVTVTNLSPTAKYTVSAANVNTGGLLEDAAGNAATVPAGLQTVNFTTDGGTDLSATAPSVVLASPATTAMTHNTATVNLDWPTVAGAMNYNIYRQTTVGTVDHGMVMIQPNHTVSNFTATLPAAGTGTDFVGSTYTLVSDQDEAISHQFFVAAVNANGDEGALSTDSIVLKDNTQPTVGAAAACTANGGRYGGGEIAITYSEPVVASEAETAASYTGLPASPVAAEYNMASETVTFYFNAAVTCGTPTTVTITATAVHDVAGNELNAASNTTDF